MSLNMLGSKTGKVGSNTEIGANTEIGQSTAAKIGSKIAAGLAATAIVAGLFYGVWKLGSRITW